MAKNKEVILILHNIRSLHNVGSIFRTADAAGVNKIYLTGYTPSPLTKLGETETQFAKTALGAEKSVEWNPVNFAKAKHGARKIKKIIMELREKGFQIIALEQSEGSTIYNKFKPKFPLALILGNEVKGLDKKILKQCDNIIEIPMRGKKESLNVSVAAGIALFSLL